MKRLKYSIRSSGKKTTASVLFFSFMNVSTAFTASAQTNYEAEAPVNVISGTADIASCSACSGGKNVQNLGGPGGGALQFNGVNVASPGSYPVTITYDNAVSNSLTASVLVNGNPVQTVSFPSTGSWTKLASVAVSLPLNAGANSISFTSANQSWLPEIDQISVQSSDAAPAPAQAPASTPNQTATQTRNPSSLPLLRLLETAFFFPHSERLVKVAMTLG